MTMLLHNPWDDHQTRYPYSVVADSLETLVVESDISFIPITAEHVNHDHSLSNNWFDFHYG